ncbi:hypothetical protein GH714_029710 [Hevea brasiliensis]|uniref:CASP-like protein n=1 Tax=Hevea brasiliensis TaxID=3981 RepID=A0A6A6LK37_HEVBR|nr:hypothetical protein GH714_029710 [Hevea brasiliensis]
METAAAKEMNTSSFQLKSLGFSYPSRVPNRSFFIAHVMFRVLAIAFTVASISVLVTSGQDVLVFGIRTMARYSYSSAFKCSSVWLLWAFTDPCLPSEPLSSSSTVYELFLPVLA